MSRRRDDLGGEVGHAETSRIINSVQTHRRRRQTAVRESGLDERSLGSRLVPTISPALQRIGECSVSAAGSIFALEFFDDERAESV